MRIFGREVEGYPKVLLVLVAVLLVSSGLCGLQLAFANIGGNGSDGTILFPLGIVELIVMLLSAGGIVVVLLLWVATALYRRFANPPKDGVQRLFDDSGQDGKTD